MKKLFTKGAAAAFLIAATTNSSLAAAPESTMQIGIGLLPMLQMGKNFKELSSKT